MTLQDFFNWVQSSPTYTLAYFIAIPAIALLAGIFAKEEGHLSPWKYLYSFLIYLVCIPGIFAVTLNIYFFFWERRSVMNAELLLQVLPILSMILTLFIIKRNVNLDHVPGFDKLSGFMMIIGILLSLMWILDRTHFFVFASMPFSTVLIILIGGILVIRYSLKRILS
jgi:hypothetical protein